MNALERQSLVIATSLRQRVSGYRIRMIARLPSRVRALAYGSAFGESSCPLVAEDDPPSSDDFPRPNRGVNFPFPPSAQSTDQHCSLPTLAHRGTIWAGAMGDGHPPIRR